MDDKTLIPILYQDEDLLVINKPAGCTVNKSETTTNQVTVQDWAEEKFKVQSSKFKVEEESDFYKRAGIVHRLDKETSGCLIIAKNQASFENLQKQFKERTIKKTYIALAHGEIKPQAGEIRAPVGRLPWNRTRFGVLADGRESVTKYKTISNFNSTMQNQISNEKLSLLELYPETGRTHQIRVHLKHINHPIFSDLLYAGRKTSRNDRKLLSRIFLHAKDIEFTSPQTGKRISVSAPLPEDLETFLQTLES